jgi:signal transduction histidine kinase
MAAQAVPTAWWIYLLAGAVTVVFTATVVALIVVTQRRQVEQARRFSQGLVEAQDAERARIARELHDDIIQRVALIGGEVSALTRILGDPGGPVTQRIEGIREELNDLAEQVRTMARRAHPSLLEHLGLVKAVQSLAAEMQVSDGLAVTVDVDGSAGFETLAPGPALSLYRVAQEGLRNVARHAGSAEATLRLGRRSGGVFVAVEDRGRGMSAGAGQAAGLGLLGLTERLRAVQGTLSVESEPGRGTRLVAWVPEGANPNER